MPIKNGHETEKLEWFKPKKLPMFMILNRRKQIKNFLKHKDTIIKDLIFVSTFKVTLLKMVLRVFGKVM
ncbi:hypothetical protein SAMN05518871_103413 [Psychrobacillus sp. OK028]|nr:hypothetical protein SAMN05518871_103413 [Psychrobacillus sp. OK028]